MNDNCMYHIQVQGKVAEADIEAFSPPGLTASLVGADNTLLSVTTDQAGMIGLIRHLHGLGLTLLLIECCPLNQQD